LSFKSLIWAADLPFICPNGSNPRSPGLEPKNVLSQVANSMAPIKERIWRLGP
jgi:hypothetical protein